MAENLAYFVSDVHLGLRSGDPEEREERFLSFLRSIPQREGVSLYMLGDIWDFWYEYKDVVPRCGARVVAHLVMLIESGVKVYMCRGNHDVWTFSHLGNLGVRFIEQPCYTTVCGASFCLGHGDGLGGARPGYRILREIFHSRFLQRCFASLHPWIGYRFGTGWSGANRRTHKPYHFVPESEPLYRFALEASKRGDAKYFIFGHFHDAVDVQFPEGGRFIVLKDWISGGTPHARFDGSTLEVR